MKKYIVILFLALFLMPNAAQAMTTGTTGNGQSFSSMQPSLAATAVVNATGIYPPHDSGNTQGDTLGFVYYFGGNFAPKDSFLANGQQLSISAYSALFSVLGPIYGGNSTSFALPNLEGKTTLATGAGTNLTPSVLGVSKGAATVTLTAGQLPAHEHSLPSGGVTKTTGDNQAFFTMQPSLPLTRVIATSGTAPTSGGAAFLGQVATFAGNFTPGGWHAADGALLLISEYPALFSVIGTTYGGDGSSTFAVPDLRGRVCVGASDAHPLGMAFGQESTVLTPGQLPAHAHSLTNGGNTNTTGLAEPVDTAQPSLALHYIIATSGIYPSADSSGFDSDYPLLGQISEFAGDFAPSGWAIADGSLLSIQQNSALFTILGTRFGGDGTTTFALPDLRGRTLVGTSSNYPLGTQAGAEQVTLTVDNLPAHTHDYTLTATMPAIMLLLGDGTGN